jgi:hypothetical protein
MAEFNIRSESVDVEQIMKQIRSRIAEKRGVDYTEEQIRELASVRLEKFLDPKNLRSDLLEQFRKTRPAMRVESPAVQPPYTFDDQTLFTSHRGPLRFIRRLLQPILKLFFNPNTLNQVLHTQAQFNVDLLKREARRKIEFEQSRNEWNALYYEVLHNLVLETTRMGIEVKNLRMRVESLSSRLDFSERRVRALEGVVQYRPEAVAAHDRQDDEFDEFGDTPAAVAAGHSAGSAPGAQGAGPGSGPAQGAGTSPSAGPGAGRRRRRRRRGRRGPGGPPGAPIQGTPGAAMASPAGAGATDSPGGDEPLDDDDRDDGPDVDEGPSSESDASDAGGQERNGPAGRGEPPTDPDAQ